MKKLTLFLLIFIFAIVNPLLAGPYAAVSTYQQWESALSFEPGRNYI